MQPSPARLQAAVETILDDRLCISCGYNLKGLSAVGDCPECGRSIAGSSTRLDHKGRPIEETELGEAPRAFLTQFTLGLCAAMLGGVLVPATVLFDRAQVLDQTAAIIGVVGGVLWLLGLVLLFREKPRRAPTAARHADPAAVATRIAIAITQPAWICFAALAYIATLSPQNAGIATVGRVIALAVGALGLPFAPVLIADLAWWARDQRLTEWLRAAAWAVAVGAVIDALFQTAFAFGLNWLGIIALVWMLGLAAWTLGFVGTALGCLIMLFNTRWALTNARERAESLVRIQERRNAETARVAASIPVNAPDFRPVPISAPSNVSATLDRNRLDPAPDVRPYDLEEPHPGTP